MDLDGTIVALSSGRPPSAIAIVRASGPRAVALAEAFGVRALRPRCPTLRPLISPRDGTIVDRALCLHFPAPTTSTGEDVVEFHCHGGPAVVERMLSDAVTVAGVRMAEPGEFTLRAVLNGRMGLADAEALADLIEARTEAERRRALRLAEGALSRRVEAWRGELIGLLADAESRLDFADEGDVPDDLHGLGARCAAAAATISAVLEESADAEKLTDGFHIVLAGAPNAGKSTLLNALTRSEASIVTPEAGTTRDVVGVTIDLDGFRVTIQDTAGLRDDALGVEAIGIDRTRSRMASADLVIEVVSPDTSRVPGLDADIVVAHKSDLGACIGGVATSVRDLATVDTLRNHISARVSAAMRPAEAALVTRARQRSALSACVSRLMEAAGEPNLELQAEALRLACLEMARMTGEIGIEDVLDDVFGRFCIGK